MNKKYNDEEIIQLHSKGMTDKEIAEALGVTPNNLATKRRHLGLKPNKSSRDTHTLNERELSILIGTLLGDSSVRFVHNACKYPNLTFTHCVQQEEYFLWKVKELSNLVSSWKKYEDGNKLSKSGYKFHCTGKNMKCLLEIRNIFYIDNIKILPIDFLRKNFTELSLYCMYMDDGSYDKSSNSFIINTQCFSKENLYEFVNILKDKFNLNFNIKSDHCLYLQHNSNDEFQSLLLKHNKCTSMVYKCGKLSQNSVKQGNSLYEDNPVLNPLETEENAERLEVMLNK